MHRRISQLLSKADRKITEAAFKVVAAAFGHYVANCKWFATFIADRTCLTSHQKTVGEKGVPNS